MYAMNTKVVTTTHTKLAKLLIGFSLAQVSMLDADLGYFAPQGVSARGLVLRFSASSRIFSAYLSAYRSSSTRSYWVVRRLAVRWPDPHRQAHGRQPTNA